MVTIFSDTKLDYKDVLIVPRKPLNPERYAKSRNDVVLDAKGHVPLIAANMDHVGTFEMAKALSKYKILTALVKHYSVLELYEFYRDNPNVAPYTIYTLGTSETDLEKLEKFYNMLKNDGINGPLFICLDVANAYIPDFLDVVTKVATHYDYPLMAGNVVTPEGVEDILEAGASIVKVGIGPGSACSTRRETGVGYPQLSAVIECADAAYQNYGMICADGGIQNPGDCAKAFAAGANFVMMGGVLAGHIEGYHPKDLGCIWNPIRNIWESYHIVTEVPFYGMSSKAAQDIHNGGLANYRASEGKEFKIPFKGPVSKTVEHYLGGLRSACTYLGCKFLEELHNEAKFVKVNRVLNEVYDRYEE